MAKYVVSVDLPNGVKAYVSKGYGGKCGFTFCKSEALEYVMKKGAEIIAYDRNKVESYFLHDPTAATLPAGLDWKFEEIV